MHAMGMGPVPAQGPNGKFVEMLIEMLTLVRDRDRDQEPLFYCACLVLYRPRSRAVWICHKGLSYFIWKEYSLPNQWFSQTVMNMCDQTISSFCQKIHKGQPQLWCKQVNCIDSANTSATLALSRANTTKYQFFSHKCLTLISNWGVSTQCVGKISRLLWTVE